MEMETSHECIPVRIRDDHFNRLHKFAVFDDAFEGQFEAKVLADSQ
jgi:hypothetical protein